MEDQAINSTHGGGLEAAAAEFGIDVSEWLDLSTGIAPWGWPIPKLPESVWRRLPSVASGAGVIGELEVAAAAYYGCHEASVLSVPGSQFAIQALPAQMAPTSVALPQLGYFEHRKAWQGAGHQLLDYSGLEALDELIQSGRVKVAVVINPNNPSTEAMPKERLLRWADTLANTGGCLLVDEAFMDLNASESLSAQCPRSGLIVLRSLGKFFGLAGLRLGFVLAQSSVLEPLRRQLGPWAVSGPAQYLGARALSDVHWQARQRERLTAILGQQESALTEALSPLLWRDDCSLVRGPLFFSVFLPRELAEPLFQALAHQAVLVRRFVLNADGGMCLRIGLVVDQFQLQRLQQLVSDLVKSMDLGCPPKKGLGKERLRA